MFLELFQHFNERKNRFGNLHLEPVFNNPPH